MTSGPLVVWCVWLGPDLWEILATEQAAVECVERLHRMGELHAEMGRREVYDEPTRTLSGWSAETRPGYVDEIPMRGSKGTWEVTTSDEAFFFDFDDHIVCRMPAAHASGIVRTGLIHPWLEMRGTPIAVREDEPDRLDSGARAILGWAVRFATATRAQSGAGRLAVTAPVVSIRRVKDVEAPPPNLPMVKQQPASEWLVYGEGDLRFVDEVEGPTHAAALELWAGRLTEWLAEEARAGESTRMMRVWKSRHVDGSILPWLNENLPPVADVDV